MKHIIIPALALCLSAFAMRATAQNVTVHKQGGVAHVYEIGQVDSVAYFPIGDKEQFPNPETENTKTLWDIIKAQPNLKKFAAILEAAIYYSDKNRPTSLRFSEVLNGSIPLNVYAPGDASISDAQYSKLLNQANTDGWKLQQEFIANHISPQETPFVGEAIITMLNGKHVRANTLNVVTTNKEAAVGYLCIISSVLPFTPNIEEYLTEYAPDCNLAQQFISKTNTTRFDFAKSISVPSLDGGMQILDSVFTHHNPLTDQFFMDDLIMCAKGFGADLADERASYKIVMPTDQVWNDAQAKLAPHYRYSSAYVDKVKGDMNTSATINMTDPDSLSALSIGAAILVPLFGRTSSTQAAALSNGTAYSTSSWPVPASQYMPNVEVEIEHSGYKTTVYREAEGYTIRDLNNDTIISELEAQRQVMDVFYNTESSRYRVGSSSACMPFDNDKFSEITNKYGRVSNNNFYYLDAPGPTNPPKAEIKLQDKNGNQVMSGKYDIQVVVVPDWYRYMIGGDAYEIIYPNNPNQYDYYCNYKVGNIPAKLRDPDTGQISEQIIDSIAAFSKQKFNATMYYYNGNSNGKDSNTKLTPSGGVVYDGLKVDTITIAEDFEFPYTYKNIRCAYPTLYIEGATSRNDMKNGFIFDLCIDKIILKSKEDGSVTEVTP